MENKKLVKRNQDLENKNKELVQYQTKSEKAQAHIKNMLIESQANSDKIKQLQNHNTIKVDMIENLKTEVMTVTVEKTV